ncbi:MAG: hypothetical protein ACD_65C00369G0001 [uncultured bacterium]|nr:MAG: hypothetical protein ACD_65C00369G0001 [uncultured bacterium]KKT02240.1 MAG: mismatch repair protein MutL, DNA mismatch repair protein MutL protein [Candidatus Peregrinibacteria bacterium GW2011_GWF2_43_17]KKT18499.1 MAG: mismatch repair protein MutL protein [Candidatus Peregrinibacteria bacterium GW2011_GWA2_43_8]HAU39999.1 DNA mismatch repair endonuclease MutL [Candidatus Peregrinibacteria bacterium]
MALIRVLPESLINQIAAGEVVERPASVVKELVENAIDAGSTEITCEIVSGGLEAIIVSDNGSGMLREDAKMAWERHATSKIASGKDLFAISTLGFRGEALASIASVSMTEMETGRKDDVSGTFLKAKGGVIFDVSDCGCAPGTKISVFNLFYNTPARRKYMKNESTETRYIIELMQGFSISRPDIAFKLISDGKVVLDVSSDISENRILAIFGKEIYDNLVPVYYGGTGFSINGFIGKPIVSRSNKKGQFIVLNGRLIQSNIIAHAVKEAYYSMLMHEKFPWFLLNIKVIPEDVDVNVHPRKLEVRFLKQNEVYRSVYGCVESALNKNILVPKVQIEADTAIPLQMEFREPGGIKDFIEIMQKGRTSELKPVAQIANSYILAEDDNGLVIIDQHAAHERVMYEKILDTVKKSQLVSQAVLAPQPIDFGAAEAEIIRSNLGSLKEIGVEVEEFGGNTFLVTSLPADMVKNDSGEILRGLIDDLSELKKSGGSMQSKRDYLIHFAACRSAVKFGQKLSHEEQVALIDELFKIDRKETCPHGRPTMIRMTYGELEKMFGRRL